MHTLYVATTNPGKLRDFATVAGNGISIEPLPGLGDIPAPSEDSPHFEGNARAKAIYYSQRSPGSLILADDSGLEVEALDGAPGVRSARYADDLHFAGPPDASTDERNNLCLLDALAPHANRRARYRCVLAAARDGNVIALGTGTVVGLILSTPEGDSGFGYDPLFFLPERHRTMAQLDPAARLGLSHRGHALRDLLTQLKI